MKYQLYVSYVVDDRYGVFSWALANYEGVVDSDQYVTRRSKDDHNRVCHIGLRRALRRSVKHRPVMQLTLFLDKATQDSLAFELAGVSKPKYPSLYQATERSLGRFDSLQLAVFSEEDDLRPVEVGVLDDALQWLDDLNSFGGHLQFWKMRLFQPAKIIN